MLFPRVLGVSRLREIRLVLALTASRCGLLRLTYRSASPSVFTKLNTRPTSAPVYASTAPRDHRRNTRGQDGLLFLSCRALSSPTTCRFIPAHKLLILRWTQLSFRHTPREILRGMGIERYYPNPYRFGSSDIRPPVIQTIPRTGGHSPAVGRAYLAPRSSRHPGPEFDRPFGLWKTCGKSESPSCLS